MADKAKSSGIIPDARTAAQRTADDIGALLRARVGCIWIVTVEEARVEREVARIAASSSFLTRTWDSFGGVREITGEARYEAWTEPASAIKGVLNDGEPPTVLICRDLPREFGNPAVIRAVRSAARLGGECPRDRARAIVIMSPSRDVPPELAGAAVVEWPVPDRAEVAAILDLITVGGQKDTKRSPIRPGERDRIIDAALGLSGEAIETAFGHAISTTKARGEARIDPVAIAAEKKRLIKGKGLEWYDPDPYGLDAIGGLEALKGWARLRAAAFTPAARTYGLPRPKGALLVGPPGTGKSLAAKCLSTAFSMPLLKLDFGAMKGKFVGESEGNIRAALKTAETIAPCIVWADEIEKSLAGGSDGSSDGGVSADALGTFLTWMQETQSGCFVVATANDVSRLPPELLRKGRFDDLFFVDLPHVGEREAIVRASLKRYGREDEIDAGAVAEATRDFTGAEIAALVPEGLYAAFADGARALTTEDLISAAKATNPLARTAEEKIKKLREWAKGRARPASIPDATAAAAAPSWREAF